MGFRLELYIVINTKLWPYVLFLMPTVADNGSNK